jgi:hypothetical protein
MAEKDDQRLDPTGSIYGPSHAPEVPDIQYTIESRFDVTAQTSFKCAVACRRQPIVYELANENDSWIRSLMLCLQRCHRWDSFLLTYSFFLAAFLHNSSDEKWLDMHEHTILSAAAIEAPGFAL